jgi:hypothetical protein
MYYINMTENKEYAVVSLCYENQYIIGFKVRSICYNLDEAEHIKNKIEKLDITSKIVIVDAKKLSELIKNK